MSASCSPFSCSRHLPQVHVHADNTQLYFVFKPDPEHAVKAVEAMQFIVADIRKWILIDRLKLSDDQAELIVIGTRHQLSKVNIGSLCEGGRKKEREERNSYLHDIRRIRKFLNFDNTQTI